MKNNTKSFAIITLGCKVNQEEGAAIAALFLAAGYREADFSMPADIYIINTCTVTQLADRKSRQMIRRALNISPTPFVIVTGCYAQTSAEDIAGIEGVDLIIGTEEKAHIVEIAEKYTAKNIAAPLPAKEISDIGKAKVFKQIESSSRGQKRTRAYLKIEDGCEQFCTYCIVPYARGPVRSLPVDKAVSEARQLLAAGHKEIVLSGIHVGVYGRDLPNADLITLIKAILPLTGLARLRISSIEPQQVSERLIELMAAEPAICRHLHIPLQSGSDNILRAMNRHYTTAEYRTLTNKLRSYFPDIAITTDIMCGFPDESEDDFLASAQFVRDIGFADMHIFPYSPRAGTPAASFPNQIAAKIKNRRAAEIKEIAFKSRADYMSGFIGSCLEVLPEYETEIDGRKYCFGHSGNYLPVLFDGGAHGDDICKITITGMLENHLLGSKTAK